MANKKARARNEAKPEFDAPPAALAPKTGSFKSQHNPNLDSKPPTSKKRARKPKSTDDTPKAFTRLLAGPARSGLDDGPKTKKQKANTELEKARLGLKIAPNESLRDFSRRVDAAIPVKFPKGDGKAAKKIEVRKAKEKAAKEEKAAKLKAGEQPDIEDLKESSGSEEEDPEEDLWKDFRGKKKRSEKRGGSPDPWKELEKTRAKAKFGEYADAPPQLKRPREVFKMYTGAGVDVEGVPKSAGSLMKREELAGERRSIVEGYRKMMEEKRSKGDLDVKLDRLG